MAAAHLGAPPPVLPIPSALLARLRSQVAVASLSAAVHELVANAIDAGAGEISVRLDCGPGGLRVSVADNGAGIQADSMRLLGTRGATSKLRSLGELEGEGGLPTLGFRGEALAALAETAVVEVVSRARGSFETHATLLRGGEALRCGLALEQRPRPGTVVTASDIFFNQPVKRKALTGTGLRHELDRCKEAVLRLALPRPGITFTLYDCSKRAFLLKMIAGRSPEASVSQFLLGGSAEGALAALTPDPAAPVAVSGWAALPPLGAPSASKQLVYVNGHCVRAAPLCKLVDALFAALYRPNARLAFAGGGGGEELQSQHRAANRRAAFVLQLRCNGGDARVDVDGELADVHFRDWDSVCSAVKRAVLMAWRPVLSLALLQELSRLAAAHVQEGGPQQQADDAAAAAAAAEAQPFEAWLQQEQANAGAALEDLLQAHQQRQRAVQAGAEERVAAAQAASDGERGSGRQRLSGRAQRPTLAGMKHSLVLASRSLRFGGASNGAAAQQLGGQQQKEQHRQGSGRLALEDPGQTQTRVLASAALAFGANTEATVQQQQQLDCEHVQHTQQEPEQPGGIAADEQHAAQPPRKRVRIADTPQVFQLSPSVLRQDSASPQHQHQQQQQQDSGEAGDMENGLDSTDRLLRRWQPLAAHAAASDAAAYWSSDEQQQQQQPCQPMQQREPSLPDYLCPSPGGLGFRQGGSGLDWMDPADWQQQQEQQQVQAWTPPEQLEEGWMLPQADVQQEEQQQQQQRQGKPGLRFEERLLLEAAAVPSGQAARSRERPQSAPPHARHRRRAVHTNPLQSLRAAGSAVGAERQGMRGLDTVSGLGFRQQKAAVERTGSKAASGGKARHPAAAAPSRRGLQLEPGLHARMQVTAAAAIAESAPAKADAPAAPPAAPVPLPPPQERAPALAPAAAPQPTTRAQAPGLDALLSSWRNPVMRSEAGAGEAVLSVADLEAACFARLRPAALSRAQLQDGAAMRQLDDKFVPLVSGSLLAIVDQHAADERVQLEALRAQLLSEGGRARCVSSVPLPAPQPLALSEGEAQLLEQYGDRAAAWGWRWAALQWRQQQPRGGGAGNGGGGSGLALTHAPLLFGVATLSSADLKLFLHQLGDAGGAAGLLPPGVVRVLNSRACRGAIMFGDRLLPAQCQALLEALKATQLCFYCAHGRPTTAPLVDLALLRRALALRRRGAGGRGAGPAAGLRAAAGSADLSDLRAKLLRDLQP